jgi:anti-sigma factor RsiW
MAHDLNTVPQLIAQSGAITPEQWLAATPEQQKVLQRIEMQRSRLKARAVAKAQAKAVHAQELAKATGVRADAPLTERLLTFARLHPAAVAGAAGVALMVGPRKLIRIGGVLLPWIMRLQQRRGR